MSHDGIFDCTVNIPALIVRVDHDKSSSILGINTIHIDAGHVGDYNNILPDRVINQIPNIFTGFIGLVFVQDRIGIYDDRYDTYFSGVVDYAFLRNISILNVETLDLLIELIKSSRISIGMSIHNIIERNRLNSISFCGSCFPVCISNNSLLDLYPLESILSKSYFFRLDHMFYLNDHLYVGYYHYNQLLVFDFILNTHWELIDVYTSSSICNNNDLNIYDIMIKVYE